MLDLVGTRGRGSTERRSGSGLDYLFMVSYAATFGLAAAWAGRQLDSRLPGRWPGRGLGWGLACAALLDAVENITR